jgi:hypothetical protein
MRAPLDSATWTVDSTLGPAHHGCVPGTTVDGGIDTQTRDRSRAKSGRDRLQDRGVLASCVATLGMRERRHIEGHHGAFLPAPRKAAHKPDPLEVLGEPLVDDARDGVALTDLEAHPAVRSR